MKRKVIRQANQAYTITLPIDWVRKNNITKNSELNLEVSGKSLIINSNHPVAGKSVSINVNGLNSRNIGMNIIAAYAQGVDEIEIVSDEDISPTILRCLNSLIGYALVSHESNRYLVKDIHPGNYSSLDEIFKRVFQMILLFYEAAIKDIFGKQTETMESLKARDGEVNKFCLYLQRAINKMSYEDQTKGRIVFTYSFALEKISDEIERLWRTNLKYKVKKTPEIKKLLETSKEGLEKAFELYYQFNRKKIEEIYVIRDGVRKKSLELKELDPSTTRFVRHGVKIVEEAADLNHLALMKQF
jgi:phosphate uptake regulator